ncbi:protein kinase [Elusimicrobiota bacterium]
MAVGSAAFAEVEQEPTFGGTPDRTPPQSDSSDAKEKEPLSQEGDSVVQDFMSRLRDGKKVNINDAFSQLLRTDSKQAAEWIERLTKAYKDQRGGDPYAADTTLWEEYIAVRGDDPRGYSGLGESSFVGEDYGESVAAYTRAIEMGAATPDNFHGRGLSAQRLGDNQLAHSDAAMALRMDPRHPQAFSLFKLTEGKASDINVDPATGELKMPAITGEDPKADRSVDSTDGSVLPVVHPSVRIPAGEDPIQLSAALTKSAQRHLQLKDADSALEAAKRAVGLNPKNAQAYNLMATAYERKGEHAKAVAAANSALKIDADSVPSLNTRAWAYSGLNRYTEALSDADRILILNSRNAFGYINQGRALGGLGRRSAMIDSLGRAAGLEPRFRRLLDNAKQLPAGKDTELLFAGLMDGGSGKAPSGGKGRKFLVVLISSISGGLLIGLGFLHVFSPRWRERITRTVGRLLGSPSPRPSEEDDTIESSMIAAYDVKRVIATGGMGIVYEAVDRGLDRRVAIKQMRGEIRDDPKQRKRFLDEARVVAGLRHRNIVAIHSIVDEGNDLLLIFEYVEGENVKDILAARGTLPFDEVVLVMRAVCSVLDYAHSQGVIHRDLKLENFMIDTDGVVKVMDFGLARQAPEGGRTQSTTVWGTPTYMAPEADDGEIRPQSDIFSLGVCVYELVTGKTPFSGSAGIMYVRKKKAEYTPPSEIKGGLPGGMDSFIARALDPQPKLRWQSAREFYEELKQLG